MSWWGKLIGGYFGFLLGGPIGALLGAALGHQFDKDDREKLEAFGAGDTERVQTAFFTTTFAVMGHIAKADGHVSEDEIQLARNVMTRMALNEAQRKLAIELFRQGKHRDFDLDGVMDQFRQECHRRTTLLQMFMEIQIHAAYADGSMHPEERRVLLRICEHLGFSRWQFNQMEGMVQAQRHFHRTRGGTGAEPPRRPADELKSAYAALGISQDATDEEVKKAYRRLMNRHHPDKLTSKGLPEEMIKLATEKTQEIKAAYETIKASRGLR